MRFKPFPEKLPWYVEWPLWAVMSPLIVGFCACFGVAWLIDQAWAFKRRLIGPRKTWSRWFAWHPVETSCWTDAGSEILWLEVVERRLIGQDWTEYKALGDSYESDAPHVPEKG